MSDEPECEVKTSPLDFSKVSWWRVGLLAALGSLLMPLPFVSSEFGFFTIYFLLIMFIVMSVVSFVGFYKGAKKLNDLVTIKPQNKLALSSDDGLGRLAVMRDEQKPDGQVSLKDEEQTGQVALAQAKQKQTQ